MTIEEDDIWDFSMKNDIIELSPRVNGKKNQEGGFCSKDAVLYDSSAFNLGNEDGSVISAFSFEDNHKAPNYNEIQGKLLMFQNDSGELSFEKFTTLYFSSSNYTPQVTSRILSYICRMGRLSGCLCKFS